MVDPSRSPGSDALDETRIGDPSLVTASPAGAKRRLALGDSLGRYIVVEVLGEGGMGTVYGAYDPELDRKVALKVLRPRKKDLELATARLRREAQAMAKLADAHVVAVHDMGTHHDQLWVAMDFVDGSTLRSWMDKQAHAFDAAWPLFRAAGLGLAAAHRAGLVHRDFKPANVLLGDDGRVQVADFGLARLDEEHAAIRDRTGPQVAVPPAKLSGQEGVSLSTRVTRTGAFLGTPAYMAPEQFSGGEVDGRTDQFAFAIALWEALCGERPFAGENPNTVMFNVIQGQVREPPKGVDMPRRVRVALMRALSTEKEARFADMPALLAALEPPRRRWLWPSIALGAAAIAAAVIWTRPDPAAAGPSCDGVDPAMQALWNDTVRGELATKLAGVDASWAREVGQATLSEIDAWVPRYQDARREACEATRVRGEQSEQLMDLRMLCLDRRRQRLDALLSVLREADDKVLRRAGGMVQELDDLQSCADREALTARVPPPSDPAARAELSRLEGVLERVWSLRSAGDLEAAETLARAELPAVDALAYPPVQAELRYELGRTRGDREAPGEALELLEAAFLMGMAHGEDVLAGKAAAGAMDEASVALRDAPPETIDAEVERWYKLADAILERGGNSPGARAVLVTNYGNYQRDRGELEQALELADEALRLYSETYGPRSMFTGDATFNRASTLWRMGRHGEASEGVGEALAIWREHVGEAHPRVTQGLSAQAVMRMQAGDAKAALEGQREVIERIAREKGEDSLALASALSNMGAIASSANELPAALEALERAAKIYEGRDLAEDLSYGYVQGNLSKTLLDMKQYARALEAADRALAIMQKGHGKAHAEVATAHIMRAEILLREGRVEAARDAFARGAEVMREANGEAFNGLVSIWAGQAEAERRLTHLEVAQRLMTRALTLAKEVELGPVVLGETHWLAHRLARDRGDAAEAEAQLAKAKAAFAEAESSGEMLQARLAAEDADAGR